MRDTITTLSGELAFRFVPSDGNGPQGKLADVELQFHSGLLAGLRLLGFAVWQRRNSTDLQVTFPARTYTVNGDRRTFALLRPQGDAWQQDAIRDAIIDAYNALQADETTIDTNPTQAPQGMPAGAVPLSDFYPTRATTTPTQEPAPCAPAPQVGFSF